LVDAWSELLEALKIVGPPCRLARWAKAIILLEGACMGTEAFTANVIELSAEQQRKPEPPVQTRYNSHLAITIKSAPL